MMAPSVYQSFLMFKIPNLLLHLQNAKSCTYKTRMAPGIIISPVFRYCNTNNWQINAIAKF
jgi:hypothetical protein